MGHCSNNCFGSCGRSCSNVTPFGIIRAVSRIGCNCGCGYTTRGCGCRYNGYNGYNGACNSGGVGVSEGKTCGTCARDYVYETRESGCGCSYEK